MISMRMAALVSVFCIALLSGCIVADSIVGCWTQTTSFLGLKSSMQFKGDGTFVLHAVLSDSTGTWKRINGTAIELNFYDNSLLRDAVATYDETEKTLELNSVKFIKAECG
jgi:hypothetical protein